MDTNVPDRIVDQQRQSNKSVTGHIELPADETVIDVFLFPTYTPTQTWREVAEEDQA